MEPAEDLPTSYIPFPNPYVHSSIVPQGARIYTEKLQCGNDAYVRYIINDAVVPIPKCATGPGSLVNLMILKISLKKELEMLTLLNNVVSIVPTHLSLLSTGIIKCHLQCSFRIVRHH